MTSINPSQNLVNLVRNSKLEQNGEKANVINQQEVDSIKEQILKDSKGLTEQQAKEYIESTEKFLKSEFTNTNVTAEFKLSDGSKDITKPTTFSFNIKGKVETQKEIPAPPSKLVADGKDFNKEEKKTLSGTPDGDKIIKRYDYLASNRNNSLTGEPQLNSASKEDLKGLYNTFGDNADKFLEALHNNPAFKTATLDDAKTILKFAKEGCNTEKDVKDLQIALKNVGPDLKARFEKNGIDEGQGKGIDGEYGFATMEGVRYLSSVIQNQQPTFETVSQDIETSGEGQALDSFTNLIPDNRQVMIAIDTSASMTNNDRSTLNKYDQVIKDHKSSDIGFMTFNSNSDGSGQQVMFKPGEAGGMNVKQTEKFDKAKSKVDEEQNKVNDIQKKYTDIQKQYQVAMKERPRNQDKIDSLVKEKNNIYDDLSKAKDKLNKANDKLTDARNDLNEVQKKIVDKAVAGSEGTHKESGSSAALKCFEQINPKGKEPYILVQTDEPDHNPETMKQLIEKGMSNNPTVDPKSVVFYNPDTRESISLDAIIKKVTTDGKFDQKKFDSLIGKHEGVKSFAMFDSQKIVNGQIQ
ncbi:MAG: hypothetical protein U0354_20490 [Candidatus Sericytochromatia bacterium]